MNEIVKIVTGNRTVRKSTTALGVTLIGGIGTSLADGSLTWGEVGVTVGAALVATAAVWKADNRPQ
jgi:hypothetical protein